MKNMKQIKKKRVILNQIKTSFPAKSINESLSRMIAASIVCQLDPTIDELADIKTAVSEAVTNCVVHAYKKKQSSTDIIQIECVLYSGAIEVTVTDRGVGIKDIDKAMEPFFTTEPDGERSGMGFTVMQSFMDDVSVNNKSGGGTVVVMKKYFTKEEKKASGE